MAGIAVRSVSFGGHIRGQACLQDVSRFISLVKTKHSLTIARAVLDIDERTGPILEHHSRP
jgi:hypothetical protein